MARRAPSHPAAQGQARQAAGARPACGSSDRRRLLGPSRPAVAKALARLREQVRKAAPQARETISYQIPTYLLHGPLVHFAAQPRHLALYVVSLDVLEAFRDELEGFEVSGRTVRFQPERPLPAGLVRRMVQARVREAMARAG